MPELTDWQDVTGWLDHHEGEQLQRLASGGLVLELGAFKGRSTCCLALVARHVVSVDSHCGDCHIGKQDSFPEYVANLQRLEVFDKVTTFLSDVESAEKWLGPGVFDLVFIDTEHNEQPVERDTRIAMRCVKQGGWIAWHDWNYDSVRKGAEAAGLVATHTLGGLGWCCVGEHGQA
jgi:predicted O-methyltransferase YrrM